MKIVRCSIIAAALTACVGPANAHITFLEPEAKASSYYAGFLQVTHGCGSSPTVSVHVTIPEGIEIARPQPKAGWTLSIERAPIAKPITSESGGLIKDRVIGVTWTGNLPADEFDQFGIMLKVPSDAAPLYFPTTQTCASGTNAWTNVPISPDAWHTTKIPAPMLVVTAGSGPRDMGDMTH